MTSQDAENAAKILSWVDAEFKRGKQQAEELEEITKQQYELLSPEEKIAYKEGRLTAYAVQRYWAGCCGLELYNKKIKPYLDIVERLKTANEEAARLINEGSVKHKLMSENSSLLDKYMNKDWRNK